MRLSRGSPPGLRPPAAVSSPRRSPWKPIESGPGICAGSSRQVDPRRKSFHRAVPVRALVLGSRRLLFGDLSGLSHHREAGPGRTGCWSPVRLSSKPPPSPLFPSLPAFLSRGPALSVESARSFPLPLQSQVEKRGPIVAREARKNRLEFTRRQAQSGKCHVTHLPGRR